MKKGEGLDVLEERMKCLDPEKYESYKFLGIEQSDKMQTRSSAGEDNQRNEAKTQRDPGK